MNKRVLVSLQESGIAAPSYTTLNGRYCLRVAISNHRSRFEDFDLLVNSVVRIGIGNRSLTPAKESAMQTMTIEISGLNIYPVKSLKGIELQTGAY